MSVSPTNVLDQLAQLWLARKRDRAELRLKSLRAAKSKVQRESSSKSLSATQKRWQIRAEAKRVRDKLHEEEAEQVGITAFLKPDAWDRAVEFIHRRTNIDEEDLNRFIGLIANHQMPKGFESVRAALSSVSLEELNAYVFRSDLDTPQSAGCGASASKNSPEQPKTTNAVPSHETAANSDSTADLTEKLRELVSSTPKFDQNTSEWVPNRVAAEIEGLKTRTLSSYRRQGIRNDENTLGRDPDGRVWRRPVRTKSVHPWYLASTLTRRRDQNQDVKK